MGTGRRGPPALSGEGEGCGGGLTGQGSCSSWGAGKDECHGGGGWGTAAVVPWRAPRLECLGPGGGACLEVLLEEAESPGEPCGGDLRVVLTNRTSRCSHAYNPGAIRYQNKREK